jgi:hypothetical protein
MRVVVIRMHILVEEAAFSGQRPAPHLAFIPSDFDDSLG